MNLKPSAPWNSFEASASKPHLTYDPPAASPTRPGILLRDSRKPPNSSDTSTASEPHCGTAVQRYMVAVQRYGLGGERYGRWGSEGQRYGCIDEGVKRCRHR